jgi:hypothetical protein
MKTFITFCLACALIGFTEIMAHAQSENDKKEKSEQSIDPAVQQRLSKDLLTRFPLSKNSKVTWQKTARGYAATYSYNDNNFMSSYNKDASYQGTLIGRDWETQAPSITRTAFNNSQYKTLKIGSYWEVNEGPKRGSYIMATNEQGAPTYFFIDEHGQIFDNPFDN